MMSDFIKFICFILQIYILRQRASEGDLLALHWIESEEDEK